jgi:peptide/nickel transport system permease protein
VVSQVSAGGAFARVVTRRLGLGILLLCIITALSFVLVSLTPGDAAHTILGDFADPGTYQALRHSLGLDEPVYVQWAAWAEKAVQGDLGRSLLNSEPVTHAINARLPVTFSLIAGALLVTLAVGIPLGVFGAVRGGLASRIVDGLTLIAFSLPTFWIGAVLIAIFAVKLRWFPATGYVSPTESPLAWLFGLVLPVVALALHSVAVIAKQTREAMLDALSSEHIRMAWATGISPTSIYYRHALRNAAMRLVTIVGLLVVGLMGGTVLVEAVFALPGLGGLAVSATSAHDLPMIQGVVVYFTAVVVVVNLAIDLAYTWLDPRVRTS